MEFWFRQKYLLPPTDPRFLDASIEEIVLDYYTWRAAEHPEDAEEYEDEDFDPDADLAEIERSIKQHPDDWEDV